VPNYLDRLALTDVFDSLALYQWSGYRVGQGSNAEGVSAIKVTPSFFHVLRAQAAEGRLFTEEDGTPGGSHVVVLTAAFAARRLGDEGRAVRRELRLDDEPHTVPGPLPPPFTFPHPHARPLLPI